MSEENKDLGDKAEDAFDAANDNAKDLGNKAEDAFDATKDKAKDLGEQAGEKFEDAKEATQEFAEDAKEAASDFADDAKKTANEFTDSAKEAFSGVGGENKKVLAGVLAIIFGSLGVHKFILGYQKEGIILLVATVIGYATMCIVIGVFIVMATSIIGLIEGVIYLTKSDEEFYNTYQEGKKPWF
ncbi:Tsr1131 protein [hydrothermal vent metagenome]|uniref:Tsr1131 protein n=1 Tax=hydrothermal vent metagenome TaxID=652676 RepID=A0A3B0TB58_9ZZZZ